MESDRKYLEKSIKQSLQELKKYELIQFGICLVERIIELYQCFDSKYDISLMDNTILNGNGYNKLKELFDFIKANLSKEDSKIVIENIEKYKLLIPNPEIYETNAICYIAEMIASSTINIIEYYLNNNVNKVINIVDDCLEIVNQIKGEEYYQREENKGKYNVPNEYLDPYFIKELEIERIIIENIKSKKYNKIINGYLINNKIEWNKSDW
jgi:uncharacterized protein YjaG (DUF416 family)